ncbi:MAG: heavy-metal-associated domain-containing protein, partial [Clostridia bacterium]|nr:heavy-metal-associated domain-containing protein [Clostridia bacterium]
LFVVTNALRLRFFKPSHAQNKQCNQGCTLPTNPTQITTQEENTMTYQLSITGMMCPHCIGRVQKTLEQIPGVTQVEVSLEKGTATVQCANVEQSTLVNAVTEQGYPVTEIVAL